MRGRSYSYSPSPSPPRRYCQRKRSPRPRGRYRGRDTNFPTSLWFGTSTEIADAKYHMDSQILLGRELTIVFAEENRKKLAEMRARERIRVPRSCKLWLNGSLMSKNYCNFSYLATLLRAPSLSKEKTLGRCCAVSCRFHSLVRVYCIISNGNCSSSVASDNSHGPFWNLLLTPTPTTASNYASSLIAASAKHYLLQPIIVEHASLDNLFLTDVDGQRVLYMNRE
ncbi:hypothetical protein JHK86_004421 [Glycine max]|nr:hypothetical protein JHK86_004421 [Glycine max]